MRVQLVATTAEDAKTDLPESSLAKFAWKRDGRVYIRLIGDLRDCVGYRVFDGVYRAIFFGNDCDVKPHWDSF